MRIRINWPAGAIEGELFDTDTGRALGAVVPCTSTASTWGEEVYFEVPVKSALDAAPKTVVDPGTICFWVQGGAVALPYGPTPIAEGRECRLVTAVNVIGKLDGDPRVLASVRPGEAITIDRIVRSSK